MKSIQTYSQKVNKVAELINDAERLVIGIGSGLSTAGGLCYADPKLAQKWYPEYFSLGLRTIADIQGVYWWLSNSKPEKYWGFWARHIWHIRYEAEVTRPYQDLYSLIGDRDYFICTTNVDSQAEKAGFLADRILATQGNYCYFQCSKPCTDEVYYNKDMIIQMTENMVSPFEIRAEDIPVCPRCGKPLVPNLRCDNRFVETPHLANLPRYESYVMDCREKTVIFLELGVGYNTPGIIRYPFEQLTYSFPKANLIRVNNSSAEIPSKLEKKGVSIQADLLQFLIDIT